MNNVSNENFGGIYLQDDTIYINIKNNHYNNLSTLKDLSDVPIEISSVDYSEKELNTLHSEIAQKIPNIGEKRCNRIQYWNKN